MQTLHGCFILNAFQLSLVSEKALIGSFQMNVPYLAIGKVKSALQLLQNVHVKFCFFYGLCLSLLRQIFYFNKS